jgi:hypothetical protein
LARTPLFGLAVLAAAILVAGSVLYFGGVIPAPQSPSGAKSYPPMSLEARYAGPIEGTMIQRWRDPHYGVVCYIYIPMVVRHERAGDGPAEYGSRSIGTIRCVPPAGAGG